MANFAELNSNNKVLRIVYTCNQDVADNGGDLSEQAAKHLEKVIPFSNEGVKWIQVSYNDNFRGHCPRPGETYDEATDKFIAEKPYPSWVLDEKTHWKAPVSFTDQHNLPEYYEAYFVWDESIQEWKLNPDLDIDVNGLNLPA